MRYNKLGNTNVDISQVCLGTMTWGQQNTEAEAHEQIEYALDHGINFIDTAEMYSVPPKEETCGLTEQYIGNWLSKNSQKRDDIILASKATGNGVPWVRGGEMLSGDAVKRAVDGCLQRLKTDYIDLYQLHWPNRPGPHFAKHWPGMINHQKINTEREVAQHLDILQGVAELVAAGKIRHFGLSNDTPWGISQYLKLAEQHNLPRVVSVQNEFSLLRLVDSPQIFETCGLEKVAYLPWSPLAGGALSGKYRNGAKPEGCRWTMQQRNGIFRDTTLSHQAIEAYFEIAERHGMSLTELTLAWVYQFPGVTSTIIGATSMRQLKEDIGAYSIELSQDILDEVNSVIQRYPVPF